MKMNVHHIKLKPFKDELFGNWLDVEEGVELASVALPEPNEYVIAPAKLLVKSEKDGLDKDPNEEVEKFKHVQDEAFMFKHLLR